MQIARCNHTGLEGSFTEDAQQDKEGSKKYQQQKYMLGGRIF